MALKSQMMRAGSRPPILTSSRRRRRGRRRWILPLAAIAGIAGAWWLFWPAPDHPSTETANRDPLVAAMPETEATRPATRPSASVAAADAPAAMPRTRSAPAAPPAASVPSRTPPAPPAMAATPAGDTPAPAAATPSPLVSTPAVEPPANPPAVEAPPPLAGTVSLPAAAPRMASLEALAERDPVEARAALTELLLAGGLSNADDRLARAAIERINARLVMSPEPVAGDPFSRIYQVQPGDSLERIARRETGNAVDWRFIQRTNGIRNPRAIQVGQRVKLPVGHFHAMVDKSEYRMDLFLVNDSGRVLVRSFPVGLGELNSTPEGVARVRAGSKLIDPEWHNPRTREYFASGHPENPIGTRWIGLVSMQEGDELFDTYGIHGTIEPSSIGRSVSMGCVRLLPDDVELVYEVLTEAASTVEIRP